MPQTLNDDETDRAIQCVQLGNRVKHIERRSSGATGPDLGNFSPKLTGPYAVMERHDSVYLISDGINWTRGHVRQHQN